MDANENGLHPLGTAVHWLRIATVAVIGALIGAVLVVPQAAANASASSSFTWQQNAIFPGTVDVQSIACPSSIVCYAMVINSTNGQSLEVTNDAGQTWSATALTASVDVDYGRPSCPTATTCFVPEEAQSKVLETTDGGASWQTISVPESLSFISCPTSSTCYGAANTTGITSTTEVVGTVDGGTTWTTLTTQNVAATDLTCPTTSTCFVGEFRLHTRQLGLRRNLDYSDTALAAANIHWKPDSCVSFCKCLLH